MCAGVTDAKGDAMLSKQDEADAVISVAWPPCALAGSLSGTKLGRPFVNSRIQDGVSVNSSGASSHACVSHLDALLSAPARAPAASVVARRAAPSSAATMIRGRTIQLFLVASCRRRSPPVTAWKGVGRPPCRRGGSRGEFSASRRCTEAGWWSLSRKATRHRYQEGKWRCGCTFGGSRNHNRVTWTRIGHQAIDGLDEGV